MSEWERFRQKLVVAVPEGEQLPARRFMVGVLIAGRDPNSELDHRDFKWIKAHGVRPHSSIQMSMRFVLQTVHRLIMHSPQFMCKSSLTCHRESL
jgi:hypothetical protein